MFFVHFVLMILYEYDIMGMGVRAENMVSGISGIEFNIQYDHAKKYDNNGAGFVSSTAFSCGYTENKKNFKFS